MTPRNILLFIAIIITSMVRVFPHEWNFAPVAAIALFSGAFVTNRALSFLFPLSALFLSDLLLESFYGIGFYPEMVFVYGSFMVTVLIGYSLKQRSEMKNVIGTALASSILFFLVTNFGTWIMTGFYPKTFSGLINCYVAGIPFFRGTLMGDLFYSVLLFGSFAYASRRFPILQN